MNVPEYLCLKRVHDTLKGMKDLPVCRLRQAVADEKRREELDTLKQFLDRASDETLRNAHLTDAFHMIGIPENEYRQNAARLARIIGETGKRPLSESDVEFAAKALDYWCGLRANLA